MATYTSSTAETGIQPKSLRSGSLSGLSVAYDATTISLSLGTVFTMIKVPAGARVLFMSYGCNKTGDPVVRIGDSVSATRYKSDGTLSAGLGMIMAKTFNQNYTYSLDDAIKITISVVSVQTVGGVFYLNTIFGMSTGN